MKMSELIAKYGDDRVEFQKLDECVSSFNMTKYGTRATFTTPQPFGMDGFDKLGLVLWFDRKDIAEIIAEEKQEKSK